MMMTDKEWPATVIRKMYEEQLSELPYNGSPLICLKSYLQGNFSTICVV